MSRHPLNLAFRFLLELAALAALAVWGWAQGEGITRLLFALLLPTGAALVWGLFRVPGDGADPRVAVPGIARLLLEIILFGAATASLWAVKQPELAVILAGAVGVHYLLSHDRVLRLLRH